MSTATIRVWDPFVRLFHWSLVASFAIAWLTTEEWQGLHEWAGYAAAALVAFRLLWGLVGTRYARFAQFIYAPPTVARYAGAMLRGKERRYLGHNPAGGVMILALLATLLGTAATGWMYTLDTFWGVEWVEETHELLANVMLALVAAHVAGVALASLRHGENLVSAMIAGRKRAPEPNDVS